MKTILSGGSEGEPRVLIEAVEVLEREGFGNERPNPIAPFIRDSLIPKTLAFAHAAPHILRSIVISRPFIGGVLGEGIGIYFGEPCIGPVLGAVIGELALKREVFSVARDITINAFRFIW